MHLHVQRRLCDLRNRRRQLAVQLSAVERCGGTETRQSSGEHAHDSMCLGNAFAPSAAALQAGRLSTTSSMRQSAAAALESRSDLWISHGSLNTRIRKQLLWVPSLVSMAAAGGRREGSPRLPMAKHANLRTVSLLSPHSAISGGSRPAREMWPYSAEENLAR